ncbi:MAG TPA: FtsW/RodA/SpoVE family cell cycle protein, partial [Alphaproteobacteria bacterium]|nr:FtsW/RodA/SpoVE family cell cycle protein [Alphaproteobacteria bacterium]
MKYFSRTDKSLLGRWWWTIDRGMLALLVIIMTFGVVLVATASPPVAMRIGLGQYHFVIRHLMVLLPSFVMMIGISFLDVKQIWRLSAIILVFCFFALVYVLLFGMEIKGAQRWIHLPFLSLQPSEFAKPAFLVVAAWFIAKKKDKPEFPGTKIAAGIYGVLVSLLILQPDMGMTFVVTACFVVIIFLAGLPLRLIALLIVVAMGAAILAYFSFAHVQSRVDRFLDPQDGDTFQIEKSLEAFRAGGV